MEYYRESLYPFQDRILKSVESLSLPFYLTGGTALSRFYFKHRFSDDLDLFVNNEIGFPDDVAKAIKKIAADTHVEVIPASIISSPSFYEISYRDSLSGAVLKIDFVNDVPFHIGDLSKAEEFSRIDSIDNILSNKLSAVIGRSEIKDAVDIREICLHHEFNWSSIMEAASQKEAFMDTDFLCSALSDVKESDLKQIKWISEPEFSQFKADIDVICKDMILLSENRLCRRQKKRNC
ncbi:MAG: nucleotidyl transferase AbiEii/AbiGii toxin family protein [Sphaerochaetaceae bacterium]